MPEEEIKGKETPGNEETPVTLESLQDLIKSQNEAITTMKTDSANNIAALTQSLSDKDEDVQNLTNLIGGLANDVKPEGDELLTDYSDPGAIKDLVDSQISSREKAKETAIDEESKSYYKEYADEVRSILAEEEAPDGKPFSEEAREGLLDLLKNKVTTIYSKNGTRDANKNFREAKKIYFGLGKSHGFKGSDLKGTGSGGNESPGETKKTYKIDSESKKLLSALGETEEWASEVLAKRE